MNAQKSLEREKKMSKIRYKDKGQDEFWSGYSHKAWRRIKSMISIQDKQKGFFDSEKSDHILADD